MSDRMNATMKADKSDRARKNGRDRISVRLPENLHRRLTHLQSKTRRTRTSLIIECIEATIAGIPTSRR